MEARVTATFVGPNIYTQLPVVRFSIDGLQLPHNIPVEHSRAAELFEKLPGLKALTAPCEQAALLELTETDTARIVHLFEHVCIELQNLVGTQLACLRGRTRYQLEPLEAIVPYEDQDVCLEAASLAAELIGPIFTYASDPTVDIERFAARAARMMLPVQDRALIERARSLGIPVTPVISRTIMLGHGRFQHRLSATKTTLTNSISNDLAANKDFSRHVLGEFGLPVPQYARVRRRRDAIAAAKRIGYPVVVKPNNGSMGNAVSVGMKNRREVRDAYALAKKTARSVLVEEMVEGADFRMLVINGQLCAASKRVPAHIVGDGKLTIEELVEKVNSDPRRGSGPTNSWTRIKLEEQADRLLADLGYTRESIPAEGEIVYLRRNANTSDGGTAVDVTDDVHPDNRDIAERAALAIGLDIAGVDFLTNDISVSMWESGGKICEINSRPGIRKHLWPAEGKPRDVITPILNMLFPADRPRRIPIVGVTGTGDTDLAAQLLAHILTDSGHRVGLATAQETSCNGRIVASEPLTPPAAARRILLDPDVDAAVLELRPRDVFEHGLGRDSLDVVAVVNDGATPEELLDALLLVGRTAREVVLVDDADPLADTIASTAHSGIEAPVRHIGEASQIANGTASSAEFLETDGAVRVPEFAQVGHCAQFAIAAAGCLGKSLHDARRSVQEVTSSPPAVSAAGSTTRR